MSGEKKREIPVVRDGDWGVADDAAQRVTALVDTAGGHGHPWELAVKKSIGTRRSGNKLGCDSKKEMNQAPSKSFLSKNLLIITW